MLVPPKISRFAGLAEQEVVAAEVAKQLIGTNPGQPLCHA